MIEQIAVTLSDLAGHKMIAESVWLLLIASAAVGTLTVFTSWLIWIMWRHQFGPQNQEIGFLIGVVFSSLLWFSPILQIMSVQKQLKQDCKTQIGIAVVDKQEYVVQATHCRQRQDLRGEFGEYQIKNISLN